jgi:membrane associated rhomboid family serine protease
MNWLNKLERKYGRLGIPNLMLFVVLGNALIYIMANLDPTGRLVSSLYLYPPLVLQGQIWRLITFVFVPPAASVIWIFFILYFYYMIGTNLENEWGSFKFTAYYLAGMLATILAAFLTGSIATSLYLNLSLFLAFAHIYPEFQILLFFVIPVKVKYLAWLNWAFIVYSVLFYPMGSKLMALVPIANYFLFFGNDIFRDVNRRRQVQQNRKKFFSEIEKAKKRN